MARYSALIRKIVEATAWAERQNEDVADTLKARCFNDSGIVRQTLMNAVCDPRFKFRADYVGYWKTEARNALENLAKILESKEGITEDEANWILDDFLTEWFRRTYEEVRDQTDRTFCYSEEKNKQEKANAKESMDEALKIIAQLNGDTASNGGQPEEDPAGNGAQQENPQEEKNETIDSEGKPEEDSENDDDGNDDNNDQIATERNMENQHLVKPSHDRQMNPGPSDSAFIKKLEDGYLKTIPRSLLKLACIIGRAGNNSKYSTGRFMKAGKTDIVGITTGDDLMSLLPSELAMLANGKTQNVFYRNYTAKRLQLFASASEARTGKKHHEGPVIICLDTSSSMNGEPINVAKALTIAVAIIAWRKKRNVMVVKYSMENEYENLGCNRSALSRLVKFLSIVTMGGNDENSMFQWLFRDVEPLLPDYDSADILCVSDFGWTTITDETKAVIEEQKAKGMKFYGLNIDNEFGKMYGALGSNTVNSAEEVCDSVWEYADGECREKK